MNPLKALGIDSMQVIFYKKSWNSVGKSVCNMVRSFLNSGHLLKELNRTYIILVPKTANPKTVNHFRPINLCDVFYKLC